MPMGKGKVHSEKGKGYRVKQFGATCMHCHKKMGKGTEGIVEMHGLSFYYYHPSCYKKFVPANLRGKKKGK